MRKCWVRHRQRGRHLAEGVLAWIQGGAGRCPQLLLKVNTGLSRGLWGGETQHRWAEYVEALGFQGAEVASYH